MKHTLSALTKPWAFLGWAVSVVTFLLTSPSYSRERSDTGDVGSFANSSGQPPPPWREVRFGPKLKPTRYRTVLWDGIPALEAQAEASMSLMARPVDIDLRSTPVLCWRWRVDDIIASADLTMKAGDDYAARVYVAFAVPPDAMSPALRAKLALARGIFGREVPDAAINYVWDNKHPVGTRTANAYTDRAHMVVRRSGRTDAGRWVTERADVLSDGTRAFGTDRLTARVLAVASDTDDTGESVRAGFADLHFVERDAACRFPPRGATR